MKPFRTTNPWLKFKREGGGERGGNVKISRTPSQLFYEIQKEQKIPRYHLSVRVSAYRHSSRHETEDRW